VSKRARPDTGGRTDEEREAARREREARRAGREGPPPPDESPRAPFGAETVAEPKPRRPRKHASADGKSSDGNAVARQTKPRQATKSPPASEAAAAKARRAAQPVSASGGTQTREAAPAAPAAPTADWLDEARRLTQPQAPAGRLPPAGRARLRVALLIVGLAVLAVLLFAAWFANSLFQPFKGDGTGAGSEVRVTIPRGAGVGEIADLLEQRGVVSSSFFFQTRARLAGRTGELKPGSYGLRHDMGFTAALDALEKGTPPSIVVITIPEGRSRREVASLVKGKLRGDYLKATRRSRALNPREYGAKGARDLEGFLFPATFELKRGKPISELVKQQLSVFRQKFENVDMRYARRKNLTPYDVLTIASLIEREAQLPKERPLIASVIYNRLHRGMPLGIDASVRFVTHNWERPLRESELANPSPYNTRIHAGLPPGPIGNPGIASIRAAARPAKTGYLFYVVKPGGNGSHSFSKTDAEFQRDVARYNSARDKRGGQSPTSP
jgi:UPF0755 protein